MQIRLAELRNAPFRWDESVEVPAASLGAEELVALGPVRWRGKVTAAEPGYYLRARLDVEQTLRCDRCLAPFTVPAGADLELLLVEEPAPAGDEIELAEGDLGVVYVAGEVFDTEPLLREQLQLGVPMKPLCRPDCRGLCPQCGADLNAGDCGCRRTEVDPRWADLAALRDRLAGGS
jgi:DUF177 domain-containing protein